MSAKGKFYMVREKALPDVLLKVVEVNELLSSGKTDTIQEAISRVGISRSSYYKYKDDIFPVHEKVQGTIISMSMEVDDQPGLLSSLLKVIAAQKANVLSIHQSAPVGSIALVTLSVVIRPNTGDVTDLFEAMEKADGVRNLKIVSAE